MMAMRVIRLQSLAVRGVIGPGCNIVCLRKYDVGVVNICCDEIRKTAKSMCGFSLCYVPYSLSVVFCLLLDVCSTFRSIFLFSYSVQPSIVYCYLYNLLLLLLLLLLSRGNMCVAAL